MESGCRVFDKDAGGYRPLAYRDIAVLLRAEGKEVHILDPIQLCALAGGAIEA